MSSVEVTTGVEWLDVLIVWVSAATVILGAVAIVWRRVRPFFQSVAQFLDDWQGEPERPGIAPARPGVMTRLATIEKELHPNGGASMRDAIDRLERQGVQSIVHVHPPSAEPAIRTERGGGS